MRPTPRFLLLASAPVLFACATSAPFPEPATPAVEAVSRFADHLGRRVHYVDAGQGAAAIVLVHGWACDTNAWHHQLPELADLGRLIAVDLPGHGRSELPAAGISMDTFVEAIVAVLDDAGVERAVVVGHSNGVPVIRNVYSQHPERVSALVGIDGTLRSRFEREQLFPMIEPFSGDDYREAVRAMIEGMPAPGLSEEDRARVVAMAVGTTREGVVDGFFAATDPDSFPALRIEVPLLLLMTDSPSWGPAEVEAVRTLAPEAEYRMLPDVGHFIQLERPDLVRDALASFLAAHDLP